MTNNIRIIPRLDIKNKNLIKGINLEGLRVMGDPNKFAIDYYNQGADEILFMDCVASLYGRNSLNDIIKNVVKNIFIPITVGGGIRSVNDVSLILNSGADKVAVNSAAVKNPELIKKIANKFGSQCFVLSVIYYEVLLCLPLVNARSRAHFQYFLKIILHHNNYQVS